MLTWWSLRLKLSFCCGGGGGGVESFYCQTQPCVEVSLGFWQYLISISLIESESSGQYYQTVYPFLLTLDLYNILQQLQYILTISTYSVVWYAWVWGVPTHTYWDSQRVRTEGLHKIKIMLVNQSKQGSNQGQKRLRLPWAWHSSAPACILYLSNKFKSKSLIDLIFNIFIINWLIAITVDFFISKIFSSTGRWSILFFFSL